MKLHIRLLICLAALGTALCLMGCYPYRLDPPPLAADYCDFDEIPAPLPTDTVIEVWAAAPRQRCWRVFGPVMAAEQMDGVAVRPKPIIGSLTASLNEMLAAAEQGQAPDIAWVSGRAMPTLIDANVLTPFDDCRQKHPIFEEVRQEQWLLTNSDTTIWGLPTGIGMNVLFYSKPLLRELGWSDADISALPEQIAGGQFTFNDLLETASEAQRLNLIQTGMGFGVDADHRLDTLTLLYAASGGNVELFKREQFEVSRSALHTTYESMRLMREQGISFGYGIDNNSWPNRMVFNEAKAKGKMLFWVSGFNNWRYYEQDHVSSADQLTDTAGVALFPTAQLGRPGVTRTSVPHHYVIFNESATGRASQAVACDVIAATYASEGISRHYLEYIDLSTRLDPIYPEDVDIHAAQLLNDLQHMIDYAQDDRTSVEPELEEVRSVLFDENGVLAETGQLTPEQAADRAIRDVRRLLGERLVVTE